MRYGIERNNGALPNHDREWWPGEYAAVLDVVTPEQPPLDRSQAAFDSVRRHVMEVTFGEQGFTTKMWLINAKLGNF